MGGAGGKAARCLSFYLLGGRILSTSPIPLGGAAGWVALCLAKKRCAPRLSRISIFQHMTLRLFALLTHLLFSRKYCPITNRYFVPEDGDSETHPNVFLAPKAAHPGAPPTLGQVRGAFPLPGRYHFRFKSPLVPGADRDKSSMAVWMDCTDDRQPVATWRGTIVAKVTRISADDGYDTDEEFNTHRNQAGAASAPTQAAPAPASDPSLDLFDSAATAPAPAAAAAASSGDLLGVQSAAAPAPAGAGTGSLLDMTGPPSGGHHQSAPSSGHHNDFMGMTASAPPSQQQQQQQQQQAPMQGQPMRQTMPPPQQQQQAYRTQGSFGSQQQGGGGTFGDLQWS